MNRTPLTLGLVVAFVVAAGCNDIGPGPCWHCPGPPPWPLPDTPQNAMIRFEAAYENQALPEYEKLFTSNFRFTFSNQADPTLVQQFGNNWGKDDEVESTGHLFDGFTSGEPPNTFLGPAAAIALSLDDWSFIDDPSRADSGAFYKLFIVPTVNLTITIAGGDEFQVSSHHDFYLVRGDAALLDPGQEARADRWYIHRWEDRAALAESVLLPAIPTTWGRLKAVYRR